MSSLVVSETSLVEGRLTKALACCDEYLAAEAKIREDLEDLCKRLWEFGQQLVR
jgi:hypothetical protein